MDEAMKARLARTLHEQRSTLAGVVRARLHAAGPDAAVGLANCYAEDDAAQADLLGEHDLAMLHQECRQLEAVELALARLADGSYGRCVHCGQPVSPARLQAQPSAALCLECQQDSERRYQVRPL
ncbi:TraR/DksA family transcriptional regulator [Pseudoduganella sp. UC29_71]|jgi:DnaK suppressor protein|uniref:TraR/DksA family transcriptional regulator n=1 Tax=Pseudoduganella sp. UC29_71 TaxID=3350174 RepID=UPI003671C407